MSQPEMGQPEPGQPGPGQPGPGQPGPEAADQVLQWITLLQGNVDEYGGQLSLDDYDAFQASLQEIAGVLRDHPDQASACRTNLIELVSRYPSIGQWLVGVDPGYRDSPGVSEPLAVEPEAEAEAPAEIEGPPGSPSRSQAGTVVTAVSVPAQPPAPAVESAPVAAATRQQSQQSQQSLGEATNVQKKAAPAKAGLRTWTPDIVMQVGKEIVTATIALIIIVSTVLLVARSFGLIGNSSHINQAKDLLSIMLGLTGTVIGYYFGRVPAEARATSATTRANQATAEKEKLKSMTRTVADNLDRVMQQDPMMPTRGAPVANRGDLQSIRDSLRDLSA